MRPSLLTGILTTCVSLSVASPGRAAEPPRVEFNRDIRPILSENCYFCHGPDKNQRKAQLRLDERESALKHGAVVPGKPDDSELVARILSTDAEDVMPPREAHKTLSDAQKKILQDWIAQGAEYQSHWAYVPPARRPVPSVHRPEWVRNPVDAFLLAALEAKGIEPSPEAPKRRLVRRLYLDILGLPPTAEEARAFEEATDPKAYEKLVDRLLESPHYGERMAVPWLDLARFTDTVGYHGDQNQRVFPYRDYVVNAFNANKPFDAFVTEQLAGDLLPNPTTEQLVATCFNRLNMMTREGGAQPGEYLAKYAADRVRTVGQTFLGSTFGCAECHDHKYDPITQRDFYTLSAFFADVKQWGVYSDYDYTPNPELKGWTNDYPFPPEIEVESPYLKENQKRLTEDLRKVTSKAPDDVAFTAWVDRARGFLESSANGWLALKPEVKDGDKFESLPDGSLLATDSAKMDPKQAPARPKVQGKAAAQETAFRFVSVPGAGWVSRIRVELIPDSRHGDKLVREGAETAAVALAAKIEGGKGKAKALTFHLADADLKTPRYSNGHEVFGILGGWRTSKDVDRTQTGYWCLEMPIELKDSQTLAVEVKSPQAVRVRVSLSPFGIDEDGKACGDLPAAAHNALTSRERTPPQTEVLHRLYQRSTGADAEAWTRIRGLCREIQACRDGRTFCTISQAMTPLETRVLPRGDWLNRTGEVVEPEVPRFLPHATVATDRRLNRLDLARWITADENPLTARVFVNRLWRQIFGVGISGVMEDVGAQGEWPTHPELLDWLAVEFRESGWDVKRMVRLMVTSSAYRQDSRMRPELKDADPGNRFVAFLSPRRLEAEFVRDNALSIAGLINLDLGGPSAFPYQPPDYYANLQFPDRDYDASPGLRQYRRGLYSHWQRTFLQPMLANFDAPAREECTASRAVANTPQQALTLLNDPTFVEAARSLAVELLGNEGSTDDAARLDCLYQRALARPLEPAERASLMEYLAGRRSFFRDHRDEAEKLLHVGQAPLSDEIDPVEAAAWAMTCRVVLNLHESITRY